MNNVNLSNLYRGTVDSLPANNKSKIAGYAGLLFVAGTIINNVVSPTEGISHIAQVSTTAILSILTSIVGNAIQNSEVSTSPLKILVSTKPLVKMSSISVRNHIDQEHPEDGATYSQCVDQIKRVKDDLVVITEVLSNPDIPKFMGEKMTTSRTLMMERHGRLKTRMGVLKSQGQDIPDIERVPLASEHVSNRNRVSFSPDVKDHHKSSGKGPITKVKVNTVSIAEVSVSIPKGSSNVTDRLAELAKLIDSCDKLKKAVKSVGYRNYQDINLVNAEGAIKYDFNNRGPSSDEKIVYSKFLNNIKNA
jgi:hypothetical protein